MDRKVLLMCSHNATFVGDSVLLRVTKCPLLAGTMVCHTSFSSAFPCRAFKTVHNRLPFGFKSCATIMVYFHRREQFKGRDFARSGRDAAASLSRPHSKWKFGLLLIILLSPMEMNYTLKTEQEGINFHEH